MKCQSCMMLENALCEGVRRVSVYPKRVILQNYYELVAIFKKAHLWGLLLVWSVLHQRLFVRHASAKGCTLCSFPDAHASHECISCQRFLSTLRTTLIRERQHAELGMLRLMRRGVDSCMYLAQFGDLLPRGGALFTRLQNCRGAAPYTGLCLSGDCHRTDLLSVIGCACTTPQSYC